jgi:histone H4
LHVPTKNKAMVPAGIGKGIGKQATGIGKQATGIGKQATGIGKQAMVGIGKKHVAKRHRKQPLHMTDPGKNLNRPALRRIIRRAGGKRIGAHTYDEMRNVAIGFMSNLMRDLLTYTEHARRKTVHAMDVIYAGNRQGRKMYY